MEVNKFPLSCRCCERREFKFKEDEFLKVYEIDFILNLFKAIRESRRKNPLRYCEDMTLLNLVRLEKVLNEMKGGLKE